MQSKTNTARNDKVITSRLESNATRLGALVTRLEANEAHKIQNYKYKSKAQN